MEPRSACRIAQTSSCPACIRIDLEAKGGHGSSTTKPTRRAWTILASPAWITLTAMPGQDSTGRERRRRLPENAPETLAAVEWMARNPGPPPELGTTLQVVRTSLRSDVSAGGRSLSQRLQVPREVCGRVTVRPLYEASQRECAVSSIRARCGRSRSAVLTPAGERPGVARRADRRCRRAPTRGRRGSQRDRRRRSRRRPRGRRDGSSRRRQESRSCADESVLRCSDRPSCHATASAPHQQD